MTVLQLASGTGVLKTTGGLPVTLDAASWRTLRLGDGGEVQDFDLHVDGTALNRTDTAGANILDRSVNPPLWSQLLSTATLPSSWWQNGGGVYCIVAAPSKTTTGYMLYQGVCFKTMTLGPSGTIWTDTGLTHDSNDYANDNGSKNHSFKIAVDPQDVNANFVIVGEPLDWNASPTLSGVCISQNGGTSWSRVPVSSIPACLANGTTNGQPTPGGYLCAFDPTSSVSGGFLQGLYVHSYGNGVYHSTDGGATWAHMSGSPTTAVVMLVDPHGHIWLQDESDGSQTSTGYINHYIPGTGWSQLNPSIGGTVQCFGIDMGRSTPGSAVLYCSDSTGGAGIGHAFCYSNDSGVTWTAFNTRCTVTATDVPWIAWECQNGFAGQPSIGGGGLWFDPYGTNLIFKGNGLGVFYCNPPTTDIAVNWFSLTAPIEQLVVREGMVCSPNGQVFTIVQDMGIIVNSDPAVYPSTHATSAEFCPGNSVAYAARNPSTVVCLCTLPGSATDTSGVSNDNGQTWTKFDTLAGSPWIPYINNGGVGGADGGLIAASTNLNFVAIRSDGTYAYGVTFTGGGSPTCIANAPHGLSAGQTLAFGTYYGDTLPAAITPGHLYYVLAAGLTSTQFEISLTNGGSAINMATAGSGTNLTYSTNPNYIYYTTDGGVTWNKGTGSLPVAIGGYPYYLGIQTLIADRVTPGTFYLQAHGLYRSTDGGATWTLANASMNPGNFLGAPKLKASPVTAGYLYYSGGYASNAGLYRSTDGGTTWPDLPNGITGFTDPIDFDFGPPAPGKTVASLWIYGTYNGVLGLYLSNDDLATAPVMMDVATPTVAGQSKVPQGIVQSISCLAASQVNYRQVFMGTYGMGGIYRQF